MQTMVQEEENEKYVATLQNANRLRMIFSVSVLISCFHPNILIYYLWLHIQTYLFVELNEM